MTKFKTNDRIVADNGHTGTIRRIYGGRIEVKWDAGQGAAKNYYLFRTDGTKSGAARLSPYKHISLLPNDAAGQPFVDWSKPVVTVCGQPVSVRSHSGIGNGAELYIGIDRSSRSYNADGTHCFNTQPRVINAPAPAPATASAQVDWAKPLQTRSGSPVKLVASTTDYRRVVEVDYGFNGKETRVVSATGRSGPSNVEAADDIINKPAPVTTTYLNVYADGTIGATPHKTFEAAHAASKYGKVRVGILRQDRRDGVIFYASVVQTTPQLRSVSSPKGINPFA